MSKYLPFRPQDEFAVKRIALVNTPELYVEVRIPEKTYETVCEIAERTRDDPIRIIARMAKRGYQSSGSCTVSSQAIASSKLSI